jgi:hypothetical protein
MTGRICLSIIAILTVSSVGADKITGADPLIKWTGRTMVDHAVGSVRYDWVGVSFSIAVDSVNTGHGNYSTILKATFDTSSLSRDARTRLKVFVSGSGNYPVPYTEVSLHPSQSEYLLAAGLTGTGGTVTVYNNQSPDYMGGSIALLSLETEAGFKPPILWTKPDRRIEFVGDSITAVSNLHRPAGDPPFGIPSMGSCADSGELTA